ncbi:MAG: nicotinamide-nucleotide amidohydrolase family protein [Clostridia bacterium]|nr:nicotinamide-nucleotide amidohydrolase family protein [Clostridia bacterium]
MLKESVNLVNELQRLGLTISCAESCTGGLVAKSITDNSGVSSVFYGGVVSYDNSVKENVLGVRSETLASVGAVSYETACQMASGVKELMKTDIGISTTGIAGPGGGTPQKPVGTVYIGIAYKDKVDAYLLSLGANSTREEIRNEATRLVISLAYEKILENY